MNPTKPVQSPLSVGRTRPRKPWVAANLSLLLAGLGQVYCGDIRKGLTHMWIISAILLAGICALAAPIPSRGSALLLIFAIGTAATVFSAHSAYRSARGTREDYRLKDYNRPACYAAFVFLFLIPVVGFGSLLRANFAEAFVVPTRSMEPTIPAGSYVVVRKDSYDSRDPERLDLVVFKNPEDRRQTFVKRVIALAGDELEIKGGVVWVNGNPLDEAETTVADLAELPIVNVPAHHCFVLGDQRGLSKDSRHFGPVPHIALVGKVMFTR